MSERVTVGTDVDFIRHLKAHGGETMKKCFQCATCSVACALSPKEYAFPRKEMVQASWGLKEKLLADPDIWLCHGCMDCSQQCPRGARPADLMAAIRSYIYKAYAVPKFMGEALSKPKHLPALFLVAIFAILLLVAATNGFYHDFDGKFFEVRTGKLYQEDLLAEGIAIPEETLHHENHNISYEVYAQAGGALSKDEYIDKYGVIRYHDFVAKPLIQALFIPGNILIFALAYMGFKRYWDDLSRNYAKPGKKPFFKAAVEVLGDLMAHKKFEKCPTNANRFYGHLYVFYGFLGTMFATAIVVLGELYEFKVLPFEIFHLPYPMGLTHWVKIVGVISGVFLFIGAILLLIKRINTEAREGKSVYNDWLFLWVILGVGLTGLVLVFVRMPENPAFVVPSNIIYFIHLVLVFFLLWYMPWSKFAHMIYRFVGLTYLKSIGRENKPEVFESVKFLKKKEIEDKVTA